MHQSPQKQPVSRRDRFSAEDVEDKAEDRRAQRASPPKARKFALREDGPREPRGRTHPRG